MSDEITLKRAMDLAVATEDMGAQVYGRLAEKFADQKEVAEVFSILAGDEKAHSVQFQALRNKVAAEDRTISDDEGGDYLRAMAMSEFFRGDTGLISRLEEAKGVDEALICVLEFEKATLGYYVAVKDVVGASKELDNIMQAEKSHITRLVKYVLTDEKMKSLADRF